MDQQRVDEIDAEGGVRELCDRPGMPEFPPLQREEEAEGGARLQEARQREVAEEPAVRLALVAGVPAVADRRQQRHREVDKRRDPQRFPRHFLRCEPPAPDSITQIRQVVKAEI